MSTIDVGMRLGDAIDPFQLANGVEAVIGDEYQERSNPLSLREAFPLRKEVAGTRRLSLENSLRLRFSCGNIFGKQIGNVIVFPICFDVGLAVLC